MDIPANRWTTAGFGISDVAARVLAAPTVTSAPDRPDVQTRAVRLVAGDVAWDQVLQTALANSADIYVSGQARRVWTSALSSSIWADCSARPAH